jgi:hypothetical protein
MDRINWRAIWVVVGIILLLAYHRAIAGALAALKLGEIWHEFAGLIWSGPPAGRFVVVCLVLLLLFVTAYTLLLALIRQKRRNGNGTANSLGAGPEWPRSPSRPASAQGTPSGVAGVVPPDGAARDGSSTAHSGPAVSITFIIGNSDKDRSKK